MADPTRFGSTIYDIGLSAGKWKELAPPNWHRGTAIGHRPIADGLPHLASFELLKADTSVPIEVCTDMSKNAPGRLIVPGSRGAVEFARQPWDLTCTKPVLKLKPRHTPEGFSAATGAPALAADGVETSDLDEFTVWLANPAAAANVDYTIWLFNGTFWAPHPDHNTQAVPAAGLFAAIDNPGRAINRVYVELSGAGLAGIASPILVLYSFSGAEDMEARVTVQVRWW